MKKQQSLITSGDEASVGAGVTDADFVFEVARK